MKEVKERSYNDLPCRGVYSKRAPSLSQPTRVTLSLYVKTDGSVGREATCKYLKPEGTCNAGKTGQAPVCPRVRPEREFQRVSDTPTPAALVTLTEAATGKTDKAIAEALGRSVATVRAQLQSVDSGLGEDQDTKSAKIMNLVRSGLIDPLTAAGNFDPTTINALSSKEKDRLQELVDHPGLTDEALAKKLFVSPTTLRTQIRNIKRKIGSRTRTSMIVRGYAALSLKPHRSPNSA